MEWGVEAWGKVAMLPGWLVLFCFVWLIWFGYVWLLSSAGGLTDGVGGGSPGGKWGDALSCNPAVLTCAPVSSVQMGG